MHNSQMIVGQGLIVKNGRILIGLRNSNKPHDAHGLWQLPAGKVEFGETPRVATVREVYEESGYRVAAATDPCHVANVVWRRRKPPLHVVLISFQCKIKGGRLRGSKRENSTWRWVTKADFKKLKFTPGSKQTLRWWFYER